mmetsp:Transcript_17845/g.25693  ORF Transcript_17845/g.25693 Transcript_17845/m.25693 type:complete len:374 (-) Transcript_17845:348-1469(-)
MKLDIDIIRFLMIFAAAIFSSIAIFLSTWLIFQHQRHFTNAPVQSKITGILWMVPIYSIDSFISLVFPSAAIYVDMLRDCYEAYVLYLFLALMLSYLKTDTITNELMDSFESSESRNFLRYCKFGTLQYCVIRPCTTFVAIILHWLHLYDESELGWRNGYIYVFLIINISVLYAFGALAAFYSRMKSKLKPFKPIGKFLCIKFIIFFVFWQSILINSLVQAGILRGMGEYSAESLSGQLQDLLICLEMLLLSLAHLQSFSYLPFTSNSFSYLSFASKAADMELRHSLLEEASHAEGRSVLAIHFAADCAIRDFNDSMPVIHIPAGFTPSQGSVVFSDPAVRLKLFKQSERRNTGQSSREKEEKNHDHKNDANT